MKNLKNAIAIGSSAALLAILLAGAAARRHARVAPPGGIVAQERPTGKILPPGGLGNRVEPRAPHAGHDALEIAARALADLAPGAARSSQILAFAASLTSPADCALIAANAAQFGQEMASAAMERWMELDPREAIPGILATSSNRAERSGHLDWMFRSFSNTNPAEALELADTLPGLAEAERRIAVAAALPAYARAQDSGKAIERLKQLPASIAAAPAAEIFGNLAEGQPETVVKSVFAQAQSLSGSARSSAIGEVIVKTVEPNSELAVSLWQSLGDDGVKSDATAQLVRGFTKKFSPEQVMDWVFANVPERAGDTVRAETFASVAAANPARAEEFLKGRPPGEADDLREAAAATLGGKPGLQMAAAIGNSAQRSRAVGEIASRMANSDPDALLQLAQTALNAPAGSALMPAVIDALAYQSSGKAIAFVNGLTPEQRDTAALRLVEKLADANPAQAAVLAAGAVGDTELRVGAIGGALRRLIETGEIQGMPDMAALPAGERDLALSYAAAQAAPRNPGGALQAAQQVQDSSLRNITVQKVLLSAANSQSPAQALAWLEGANLDAGLKTALRQQLGQ